MKLFPMCSPTCYWRLVLLLSWGALTAGLVAQYGFNIRPCILCIYERYIYVALAVVAFTALRDLCPPKWMAFLMGVTLLTGIFLGGYHVGVEQHWWLGTEKCGSTSLESATTIEELRAQIMQATPPRCDQVGWRILGLPATFWNLALLTAQLCLGVVVWRQKVR